MLFYVTFAVVNDSSGKKIFVQCKLRQTMKLLKFPTIPLSLLLIVVVFFNLLISCTKVPLTGRKQLNLYPESEMIAMSLTSYSEFLKQNKLSSNTSQTAWVKNSGQRIQRAVEKYLAENGLSSRLTGYQWEFNLVENAEPNAWCMPGGKVVVYSGIMPVAKDEAGLAVVMGHEIAHAIARHGNERFSEQMLVQMGGVALDVALQNEPTTTRDLWLQAYGIGTTVGVMLPYSRAHETEADKLGLIFMAMAGYDPNNAIGFWQRMQNLGGNQPPEFLSTHPGANRRINDIKAYMPEAMKYYKKQ